MTHNFPKIELSDEEQLWLGTICQQFLKGYLVDVDQLKKSWHMQGKWSKDFQPSEIDSRLLQNRNKPTLLGIWHAYPVPKNNWIGKFDQLIRYVKERISNSTSTEIKVAEIAEAIGVTERSVSVLIHLLPSMGFYYTATTAPVRHDTVRIPGELEMYSSLHLDDPEKMSDYLSYENMEEQIKRVYGEPLDIFISFSENEKDIALRFQLFLKMAFGEGCKIFVSSDKESMAPGDWFNHVVSNLKNAQTLIILTSRISNQKEWINYETGVAEGVAKHHDNRGFAKNILPIVIGGLPKKKVSGPLQHYQISDIHDAGDINWLINQVTRLIGKPRKSADINQLIKDVKDIEKRVFKRRSPPSKRSKASQDEELEWKILAELTEASKEGLVLNPPNGSEEWKAAERLVTKGSLEKLPPGMGYAIPGQKFKIGL
jgi:hypothetical protein